MGNPVYDTGSIIGDFELLTSKDFVMTPVHRWASN